MTQEDEERELRGFLFCFLNERTPSHHIRGSNVRVIGISEEEEKKKGTESLLKEIVDENFPSPWKELDFK